MADTCGFSSGFDSGFDICVGVAVDRPFQAPSFGRVSRPSLPDPTLMLKPEGSPLRELASAGAALRRRLRAD